MLLRTLPKREMKTSSMTVKLMTEMKDNTLLPPTVSSTLFFQKSLLHSHFLSRNLKLFTNKQIVLPVQSEFQVLKPNEKERPLTLLYSWMMAKDAHVSKYIKFYTELGVDVLKVRTSPLDLLRPTKGSQVVADQVLKFLQLNQSFSPLILHGFSVGAYSFCEAMFKVHNEMDQYGNILKRFMGQIFDSAVDIDGIPQGLPLALTNNKVIQRSLESYLRWYLKVNYNTATIHYRNSSSMMHLNRLGAPGLFIYSKKDPISTPEMNARVYKKWEANGYPVFTKCFESSPHVSHFYRYQKDYQDEVLAFLENIGMVEPTKGRAVVG